MFDFMYSTSFCCFLWGELSVNSINTCKKPPILLEVVEREGEGEGVTTSK